MNNWIPCSERLPDLGQQVLTYRPNTNHFYPKYGDSVHVCLVYRSLCIGSDNKWYWQEFGPMTFRAAEMTHWHSVPEFEVEDAQETDPAHFGISL